MHQIKHNSLKAAVRSASFRPERQSSLQAALKRFLKYVYNPFVTYSGYNDMKITLAIDDLQEKHANNNPFFSMYVFE